MRLAFTLLILLTVAGCSNSRQLIDNSQVKLSADSSYNSIKVGVGQGI